ncbi:kelch-like protein 9 [Lingula anatina]|nr:kelch-like protein 9 [Lingula anatina]|eukprot:XP_013408062.1 kelch-like protein 9 [Lingula anatina]
MPGEITDKPIKVKRNFSLEGAMDKVRATENPTATERMVHFALMGQYLKTLYTHDQLCDVIITVGNYTFSAHCIALACHSDYFAEVLLKNRRHTIPLKIRLEDITASAFQKILEFIYTAEIRINYDNVGEMYVATRKLQILPLLSVCQDLFSSFPPDKAIAVMETADRNKLKVFYEKAYKVVLSHFPEIYPSSGFPTLDVEKLHRMLQDDDLRVLTELDVFRAAMRWLTYDKENRMRYAAQLMSCVRFMLMTSKDLVTCVEEGGQIMTSDGCQSLILAANWYRTCVNLGRESTFPLPTHTPRTCMVDLPPQVPESTDPRFLPSRAISSETACQSTFTILAIGGFSTASMPGDEDGIAPSTSILRYNPLLNTWKLWAALPEPRTNHAVAIVNGVIYIVGGCNPRDGRHGIYVPKSTVFKVNARTRKWSQVTSMNENRMHHKVAVVSGLVYAVGGEGLNNIVLASVEVYNHVTNQWSYIAPLSTGRIGIAACAHSGLLYIVGGYADSGTSTSGEPILNLVECYDPHTNRWSSRNPIPEPRCHANLSECGGKLYLSGGAVSSYANGDCTYSSVGSILEYHEKRDQWTARTEMTSPRHNAGSAALGSCLYVMGGISTLEGSALSSVECFDTMTGIWSRGEDMPSPVVGCACVVLPPVK